MLERHINKLLFFMSPKRNCEIIRVVCTKFFERCGIDKKCYVSYVKDGERGAYLVQLYSRNDVFSKVKKIALLKSILTQKVALALGIDKSQITLILSINHSHLDYFLVQAEKMSIEDIEYLLFNPNKQQEKNRRDSAQKKTKNAIKVETCDEYGDEDSYKSVTASEIEFEEYLNVATAELKKFIAIRRSAQNKQNNDYLQKSTLANVKGDEDMNCRN